MKIGSDDDLFNELVGGDMPDSASSRLSASSSADAKPAIVTTTKATKLQDLSTGDDDGLDMLDKLTLKKKTTTTGAKD